MPCSRPRIADTARPPPLSAVRGRRPSSANQSTRTRSPSGSQVPRTTPPATTTGRSSQLACSRRLAAPVARRDRPSCPAPARTGRTPAAGARLASASSRRSSSRCSGQDVAARRRPRPPRCRRAPRTMRAAAVCRTSRRTTSSRTPRSSPGRGRRGRRRPRAAPPRLDRNAGPARARGLRAHEGDAGSTARAVDEVALPASGFSGVPRPEASPSPTCSSPRFATTAATSSSGLARCPRARREPRPGAPPSASGSARSTSASSAAPTCAPRPCSERNAPPSSGVSRCSAPRIAQVLTSRPAASARDLARSRRRAAGSDRELGGRRDLRLHAAEPPRPRRPAAFRPGRAAAGASARRAPVAW